MKFVEAVVILWGSWLTERQRIMIGVSFITETKRKVFRFHETILSLGDWIPKNFAAGVFFCGSSKMTSKRFEGKMFLDPIVRCLSANKGGRKKSIRPKILSFNSDNFATKRPVL